MIVIYGKKVTYSNVSNIKLHVGLLKEHSELTLHDGSKVYLYTQLITSITN